MAGKNASGKGKAGTTTRDERAPFVGYVNITLTEEDRVQFESWAADDDIFQETYVEALADGYQFTSKFDIGNDSYSCSVSTWDRSKPDAGIIYTGRSGVHNVALLKCLFVLSVKLNWDLSNGHVKRGFLDAF